MATTEPRTFGNRYEVGSVLGYGGMAEVYAGRDLRLGREVAIKVLRADLARDPAFLGRFRREAQAAASLNHPNIVAVYDTGEDTGPDGDDHVPYIVMEYVAGRTLRDVLTEDGRLLPRRAMEIVADVASALEYSHRAGIVHRDIKPANVMLTPSGEVKVMDFGIARAASAVSATMTHASQVLGTAQYLSPEQARGEHVDARSDLYSAGCLLYELLTGVPPFQGESAVAVAYQHVREDPVRPSQLDPELPGAVDAVVLKAMAKNPANRYQDAAEFRTDLQRAAAGRRVDAPAVLANDATTALPAAAGTTVLLRQDDDDRRGRRIAAYIALAIAVVLILVGAALLTKNLVSGSEKKVTVPTLTNLTEAQARQLIADRGLTLSAVNRHFIGEDNNSKPAGIVYAQSPFPGATEKKNGDVQISVSGGVKRVQIPTGLAGLPRTSAEQALTALGLQVAVVQQPVAGTADSVLSVDPPAGTTVLAGSTVNLVVVLGTQQVPSVRGEDADTAERDLTDAGFKVTRTTAQSDTVPDGQVISQSPSGSQPNGTTITLVISSGPPPTPTPVTTPPTTPVTTPATTPATPVTPVTPATP